MVPESPLSEAHCSNERISGYWSGMHNAYLNRVLAAAVRYEWISTDHHEPPSDLAMPILNRLDYGRLTFDRSARVEQRGPRRHAPAQGHHSINVTSFGSNDYFV
jgi:hypothetical protein